MRWGHTARDGGSVGRNEDPIRHAWDGFPAKRKGAPVHALCGAALRVLGPRSEGFDANHPRACRRCARGVSR
jgi:hypothetical protein